jgi:hypothetical protein
MKTNKRGWKYRSIAADWGMTAANYAVPTARTGVSGDIQKVGVHHREGGVTYNNGGDTSNAKEATTRIEKIDTADAGKSTTLGYGPNTPPRKIKLSERTSPFSLGLPPTEEGDMAQRRLLRGLRFAVNQDVALKSEDAEADPVKKRRLEGAKKMRHMPS